MSLAKEQELKCPTCGDSVRITVWTSVNVSLNPELRDALIRRRLNIMSCKLGHETEIACDLLYHDMDRDFMIWLRYPGDDGTITLSGTALDLVNKVVPRYRRRVVRTRNELIEKVLIFEANLDDRLIELVKVAVWARLIGHDEPPRDSLFFTGLRSRWPRKRELVFNRLDPAGETEIRIGYESGYLAMQDKLRLPTSSMVSDERGWELVGRDFAIELARRSLA